MFAPLINQIKESRETQDKTNKKLAQEKLKANQDTLVNLVGLLALVIFCFFFL